MEGNTAEKYTLITPNNIGVTHNIMLTDSNQKTPHLPYDSIYIKFKNNTNLWYQKSG